MSGYVVRPRDGGGAAEVSVLKIEGDKEHVVAHGALVVDWPKSGDYAPDGTALRGTVTFVGKRASS